MLNTDKIAELLQGSLFMASRESNCNCDRLFFDNSQPPPDKKYDSGVCDDCNTLLIVPRDAEFKCPVCDANANMDVEIVETFDEVENVNPLDVLKSGNFTPIWIKHYTWRERVIDKVTGFTELCVPHSDPDTYEYALGLIFESVEEAMTALDTHGVRDEAMLNKWVLVTVKVTEIIDVFK